MEVLKVAKWLQSSAIDLPLSYLHPLPPPSIVKEATVKGVGWDLGWDMGARSVAVLKRAIILLASTLSTRNWNPFGHRLRDQKLPYLLRTWSDIIFFPGYLISRLEMLLCAYVLLFTILFLKSKILLAVLVPFVQNLIKSMNTHGWRGTKSRNLVQSILHPPRIPLFLNVSWDIGPNLQFNAINFGSPAAQRRASLTSYSYVEELIPGLLSADAREICARQRDSSVW